MVPLAMPEGIIKTVVIGMVGGLVGSLLGGLVLRFMPSLVGINLLGAVIGTAVFILARGAFPFVKILLGRT
ncbi:MAG: hypothetical protein Q7T04_08310 [Dehalococcoidia bacterium]|nr:hypothetical protein [Dehalococcoidia bacterium]